jgi:hypothetical protein
MQHMLLMISSEAPGDETPVNASHHCDTSRALFDEREQIEASEVAFLTRH